MNEILLGKPRANKKNDNSELTITWSLKTIGTGIGNKYCRHVPFEGRASQLWLKQKNSW
jgi:hypothetical protein